MYADRDQIGAALGRIPSGCFILTAAVGGRATGVLVSWVQQAAFEPPSLTVCLKHGRPVMELIDASGRFLLNVIGQDWAAMFRHFGRGFTLDEDAFSGLRIEPTEFGPMLRSSISQIGCRVGGRFEIGDHTLYAAEALAAQLVGEPKPYVHLRKSGLSY